MKDLVPIKYREKYKGIPAHRKAIHDVHQPADRKKCTLGTLKYEEFLMFSLILCT